MTMDAASKRYWKESNGLSLSACTIFGSFQFFVFTKYVASFSFFDTWPSDLKKVLPLHGPARITAEIEDPNWVARGKNTGFRPTVVPSTGDFCGSSQIFSDQIRSDSQSFNYLGRVFWQGFVLVLHIR